MELERNKLLMALILIGIIGGFYYYYFYVRPSGTGSVNVESGSGSSQSSATARPYIEYRSEDGRILRVYLDDGSMYWVNADGTLTPYRTLTWTVPGTMTKIVQIQVGFDINLFGKYLKDQNGDGYQDITVTVTAKFKCNSTSNEYVVFNNQVFTYQVGSPTSASGGSTTANIQSGWKDISTIFSNVWGGSPAQDAVYWPLYVVTISVSAQSYWGDNLSASDSKTYDKNSIGSWQWKEATLTASLGGATAGTQSIIPVENFTSDPMTIIILIGAIAIIYMLYRSLQS